MPFLLHLCMTHCYSLHYLQEALLHLMPFCSHKCNKPMFRTIHVRFIHSHTEHISQKYYNKTFWSQIMFCLVLSELNLRFYADSNHFLLVLSSTILQALDIGHTLMMKMCDTQVNTCNTLLHPYWSTNTNNMNPKFTPKTTWTTSWTLLSDSKSLALSACSDLWLLPLILCLCIFVHISSIPGWMMVAVKVST